MKVYISAASQRQEEVRLIRDQLVVNGIEVTSSWIDQDIFSNDPKILEKGAKTDYVDILESDVVLFINPVQDHHTGTGGRHVEVGLAIAIGLQILIYGERENVFHWWTRYVQVIPYPSTIREVISKLREII